MAFTITPASKILEGGNMKLIPLTQGKFAQVDDADYDILIKRKWYFTKAGYAVTKIKRRAVSLHRIILGDVSGKVIDHIDGDGLNNKRNNLRRCLHIDNMKNQGLRKNKKSGNYKGVSWHIASSKWMARIQVNKKAIHLGLFACEISAARAYNAAAVEHFGEFARINQI